MFLDLDNIKVLDDSGEMIKRIEHRDIKLTDYPLYELAEALAIYKALEELKDEDKIYIES